MPQIWSQPNASDPDVEEVYFKDGSIDDIIACIVDCKDGTFQLEPETDNGESHNFPSREAAWEYIETHPYAYTGSGS